MDVHLPTEYSNPATQYQLNNGHLSNDDNTAGSSFSSDNAESAFETGNSRDPQQSCKLYRFGSRHSVPVNSLDSSLPLGTITCSRCGCIMRPDTTRKSCDSCWQLYGDRRRTRSSRGVSPPTVDPAVCTKCHKPTLLPTENYKQCRRCRERMKRRRRKAGAQQLDSPMCRICDLVMLDGTHKTCERCRFSEEKLDCKRRKVTHENTDIGIELDVGDAQFSSSFQVAPESQEVASNPAGPIIPRWRVSGYPREPVLASGLGTPSASPYPVLLEIPPTLPTEYRRSPGSDYQTFTPSPWSDSDQLSPMYHDPIILGPETFSLQEASPRSEQFSSMRNFRVIPPEVPPSPLEYLTPGTDRSRLTLSPWPRSRAMYDPQNIPVSELFRSQGAAPESTLLGSGPGHDDIYMTPDLLDPLRFSDLTPEDAMQHSKGHNAYAHEPHTGQTSVCGSDTWSNLVSSQFPNQNGYPTSPEWVPNPGGPMLTSSGTYPFGFQMEMPFQ